MPSDDIRDTPDDWRRAGRAGQARATGRGRRDPILEALGRCLQLSTYHYLKGAPHMPFSTTFTGFDVDSGDPVCFVGVTGIWSGQRRCARACRLVVHPEWQGAGIGMRFLNTICQRELEGVGFIGQPVPTYFHTAAPALCSALRRDPRWTQVSQKLVGDKVGRVKNSLNMKYGGHDRAVAGFKYTGATDG